MKSFVLWIENILKYLYFYTRSKPIVKLLPCEIILEALPLASKLAARALAITFIF